MRPETVRLFAPSNPMPSRVYLRHPTLKDECEFLFRVKASRALHRPWVAPPGNPKQYRQHFAKIRKGNHCGFIVCRAADDAMVGVINVTHMILGSLRSAFVGYYAFAGFERLGLMQEGLNAVVRHGFNTLKLHRLEANIQPGNVASIALARSCGFSKEGYSPRYLKIGGRWQDHERWAILAS